jgi:hypothetical protein
VRVVSPRRTATLGAAALLACSALISACGSSSASSSSPSGALGSTCTQVGGVLSDGPDPGVDPVGYADAQILPLRQIHTADPSLHRAIDDLASAYQRVERSNGATAATKAAAHAASRLDAICPGVSS